MRRKLARTVPVLAFLTACSGGGSPVGTAPSGSLDSGAAGSDGGVDAGNAITDDGGSPDVLLPPSDAGPDAGEAGEGSEAGEGGVGTACEWGGAPGVCMTVTSCAAIADHSSYANECPGPASVECCIVTPSTADNPPTPVGYVLMQQAQVTTAMTTWAVDILNDPVTYPMFSTTTMAFGALTVLARVEWHPPDFQNSVIHRGVTLYEPTD